MAVRAGESRPGLDGVGAVRELNGILPSTGLKVLWPVPSNVPPLPKRSTALPPGTPEPSSTRTEPPTFSKNNGLLTPPSVVVPDAASNTRLPVAKFPEPTCAIGGEHIRVLGIEGAGIDKRGAAGQIQRPRQTTAG